jgi:hypothetical protein
LEKGAWRFHWRFGLGFPFHSMFSDFRFTSTGTGIAVFLFSDISGFRPILIYHSAKFRSSTSKIGVEKLPTNHSLSPVTQLTQVDAE